MPDTLPTTNGDVVNQSGSDASRNGSSSLVSALGLLGAALAIEAGYDLRSRCVLRAKAPIQWQLLGKPGEDDKSYDLPREEALSLYGQALTAVREAKLPIHTDEVSLVPTDDLTTLVKKSMELAAAGGDEEAS